MLRIRNTRERYGSIAIALHWLMAIILIVLVVMGLYMTWMPISALKLKLYGWHKEIGILALMLVMLRIVWHIASITPSLGSLAPWERFAARTVHWMFYGFLFALPISGWFITSAAGLPVSFFDLMVLPNLVAPNEELRAMFQVIHEWLGYGLIVTFCGHVAAALKHHFINKDDILRRIIS